MTKPGDSMEERRRAPTLSLTFWNRRARPADSWPWINWTVDTDAAAVVGKVGTPEGWDVLRKSGSPDWQTPGMSFTWPSGWTAGLTMLPSWLPQIFIPLP